MWYSLRGEEPNASQLLQLPYADTMTFFGLCGILIPMVVVIAIVTAIVVIVNTIVDVIIIVIVIVITIAIVATMDILL